MSFEDDEVIIPAQVKKRFGKQKLKSSHEALAGTAGAENLKMEQIVQ